MISGVETAQQAHEEKPEQKGAWRPDQVVWVYGEALETSQNAQRYCLGDSLPATVDGELAIDAASV